MKRTVLSLVLSLGWVAAIPDFFASHELLKVTGADFDGKLIFLQALWRHGDRTPTQQFPTDKNVWPQGLGQLTVTGMTDHLKLGEKLRERYIKTVPFISKRYVSNEIYVHSTDVNRTLISAISNMIGFYRDAAKADKDYPSDTRWPTGFVPVPVHTEDFRHDFMGNVNRPCPRTKALLNLLKESPQYKKLVEEHADFLANLTVIAGMKVTLDNLYVLNDDLFITRKYKWPVPEGFTDEVCDRIKEISDVLDNALYGIGFAPYKDVDLSLEMAKIKGGPLLWGMIERMQQKVLCATKNAKDRTKEENGICRWIEPMKYHIYSAHDTTLAGLFSTFGFNETNYNQSGLPDYASAVTLELREKDGKHFVKVLFWPPNDGENFQDITTEVRGCSENCSLDEFIKRSQPYNIDDPNELCQNDKFTQSAAAASISTLLMLISAALWYLL